MKRKFLLPLLLLPLVGLYGYLLELLLGESQVQDIVGSLVRFGLAAFLAGFTASRIAGSRDWWWVPVLSVPLYGYIAWVLVQIGRPSGTPDAELWLGILRYNVIPWFGAIVLGIAGVLLASKTQGPTGSEIEVAS